MPNTQGRGDRGRGQLIRAAATSYPKQMFITVWILGETALSTSSFHLSSPHAPSASTRDRRFTRNRGGRCPFVPLQIAMVCRWICRRGRLFCYLGILDHQANPP